MRAGAIGAVSGLAAGFPELVAAVVRDPTDEGAAHLGVVRDAVQRYPLQAALKLVLSRRGVPLEALARRPIRSLTDAERAELERELDDPGTTLGAALA